MILCSRVNDRAHSDSSRLAPMPAVLMAFLVCGCAVVDSSLTFPLANPVVPLAAVNLYAATMTSFLGPQPEDNPTNITGTVVLFIGDACKPATLHAPGRVLLVTSEASSRAACSFETIYLSLYATGAVAVVWPAVDNLPSIYVYSHDGSRGSRTRHLPMLFLRAGPSSDVYDTLVTQAPGQIAAVYPDVNVWHATFSSWQYQLFIRALPSAVLIASGTIAAAYSTLHLRLIYEGYVHDVPAGRRSVPRYVLYLRQSVGLPHYVLAIETVTATLCGSVLAINGFFSTPNLAFPTATYFMTLLSGWSFVASLLSSAVWIRQAAGLIDSKTFLTRVLRGDHPLVFALMVIVPVAVDTAVSVVWSSYIYTALLSSIGAVVQFLSQLTVGVHVLFTVLRYYWFVHDVQSLSVHASGRQPGMDDLLARLSRCALGMSLSMILICIGTALMAVSTSFLFSPSGWTICFSLAYNGRALDSVFRVAMFRPRTATWPQITKRQVAQILR
ncbi:unnamed protein product (mitochondrion) [Plasmodiophora brassicae]|uniref:Uncharacterized protein n=1 Tax=Plasmodiophora brassicae TaxID=37360 RepID=A0A3P3Y7G1_PLABS|nr:unnamed protein product [Plasmodiophora brassicae]